MESNALALEEAHLQVTRPQLARMCTLLTSQVWDKGIGRGLGVASLLGDGISIHIFLKRPVCTVSTSEVLHGPFGVVG